MKILPLKATAFLLSLGLSATLAAEGNTDVCISVMPQGAALSSDGSIGLTFGASQDENGEASPHFQDYIEYPADGACFGDFAVKSILSACETFEAKYSSSEISSPQESAPAALNCQAQSSRIAELEAQNNRLKRRLKRLRAQNN
jgi:hypothetical protein